MSSSGIDSISSGPLIIRTYNNSSSSDVTYVLRDYDYPVSSNYVLITSTNGQLVPSNNIYVSSITTSSFNSDFIRASTAYLSSVFGFSPVQFYSPVRINNTNPATDGPQLFVNGSTVFSEPGAQSTPQIAGVNIFGLPNGNPITSTVTTTTTIDISEPISKINFQLIGSGGQNTVSNLSITNGDLPGIGAYIAGTLAVKQGDKLKFFIGTVGDASNSSKGTSLLYLSSIGGGVFISTLVCAAGAGGGNGYALSVSSSSGGGHGGGGNGAVTTTGNVDYIGIGSGGYDAISTSNGSQLTYADGGQGGSTIVGGIAGKDENGATTGGAGGQINTTNLLTTGGLVNGGAGGSSTRNGGYGGGGYTGGGGGGSGIFVSAGGGGGATYIATSTLNGYLSNLVCLGGQWISQNNATPFGGDYGKANNPGFASITGYQPNDTLYTNGDIECRVLRYTLLDPPINAVGGASALWATYPAIDIVNMNDNPIVECGGIEVDSGGINVASGGINVSSFVRIQAGANDIFPDGYMSQFIRGSSSGTLTIDYQVAGNSTGFGNGNIWQDARYVYNSNNDGTQVWGIVTKSNATNVGSTIGDIHFYQSVYVDGKIGIGTINPSTILQAVVPDDSGISGIAAKRADVNTIMGAYNLPEFPDSNVGSLQVTRGDNSTFYTLALNPRGGDIYIGSTINNSYFKSASTQVNELKVLGNEYVNGVSFTNYLSTNFISTANASINTLNVNSISSGNVVNSVTAGDGILVNNPTGNITISATGRTYIDIIKYNPNAAMSINYGKYSVIESESPPITSITLNSNLNPQPGTFINFINESGSEINFTASNVQTTLYNRTLITPIFYSSITQNPGRWLIPSYYNVTPLYIFINSDLVPRTYFLSQVGPFTKLDYIIVGGGGSGGTGTSGSGVSNYGGGGGGSGQIKGSFTYADTQDNFIYNIVNIYGGTTQNLNINTNPTINVSIGGSNTSTTLTIAGVLIDTAGPGGGGQAGQLNNGGMGGNGFNGGGGGAGGGGGGIGGFALQIGGAGGQAGSSTDAGQGGGPGGGDGPICGSGTSNSSGGGGAGGTLVTYTSGAATGGRGALRQVGVNEAGGGGGSYTGAGGGGGAYRDGDYANPGPGGSGYAILYFHN